MISAPETQAKLGDMGFKVAGGMPSDMARTLSAERWRYARTIQTAGITLR